MIKTLENICLALEILVSYSNVFFMDESFPDISGFLLGGFQFPEERINHVF